MELHEIIPPSPFYYRGSRRWLGFHPYLVDIPKIRTKRNVSYECFFILLHIYIVWHLSEITCLENCSLNPKLEPCQRE